MGNLDWNGPIREDRNNNHQILGPERWEKGKVYVDAQSYKMPDWLKGPDLAVFTGVWKGDARLRIVTGPNDGENRAIVGKIHTGLAPQAAEAAHRRTRSRRGDGEQARGQRQDHDRRQGDEPEWQKAAVGTGPFVDVGTGKPNASFPVNGSAKMTWDDQNVYLLFEVTENDVVGGFTKPGATDQRTCGPRPGSRSCG